MAKNTNTTDQNSRNKNSAKQNAGKQNSMNRNGAGQNTSNRNSTGTDSEHNGYQDKVLQKAGDMQKKACLPPSCLTENPIDKDREREIR